MRSCTPDSGAYNRLMHTRQTAWERSELFIRISQGHDLTYCVSEKRAIELLQSWVARWPGRCASSAGVSSIPALWATTEGESSHEQQDQRKPSHAGGASQWCSIGVIQRCSGYRNASFVPGGI